MKVLAGLPRDARGATLVEFAFVAPVLITMLLAFFDLGYRAYATSIVQGALHDAARMATVGESSADDIKRMIDGRLTHFDSNATIVVRTLSYEQFSDVKKPEVITSDTVPIGEFNLGDCFVDANGNEQYDLDRGQEGLGRSEDIVHYEVQMTFPRLMPFYDFLGSGETTTIRSSTVLRNQPFAGRATGAATICTRAA